MRKVLRRIIVLCMACMICMSGLCMAKFIKDDDGNWVEFYREDEKPWNIYYVDTNAIKVCEYEGKKYLDVSIRRKENTVENYVYYIHQTEVTNAKFHRLLDLENRKKHNIEWQNKYAKQKRGTADISEIKNGKSFTPWDEKLVAWVEQNYPAVINEIRTFNQSGQPAGNTNVTGAAGEQGSSVADIVDNFTYEVLDSGAVKFSPRCMADDGNLPLYAPSYFIFAKPEKYSALPGAYLIGWLTRWMDGSWDPDDDTTISTNGVTYMREEAFDYDPKTQTFTFYAWMNRHTPEYLIKYRMRFIDKNTVCIIYKSLVYQCNVNNTYRYMPYDKIPVAISSIYDAYITVENKDWTNATYYDKNKCVWCGDHFPNFLDGESNLNVVVDMARAFLAVNGKVGPIPDEYNVMTSVEWYD